MPEVLGAVEAVWPCLDRLEFFSGHARGQKVNHPVVPVDRRDDALADAGHRPGAVYHLLEHGVQIERLELMRSICTAEPGRTVPGRPVFEFFDAA